MFINKFFLNAYTMKRITVDLGKGVVLSAPIKERMTLDEWQRMSTYINSLIKSPSVRLK